MTLLRTSPMDTTAGYMAARYADYTICRAHEVVVGDGVRLVPAPGKPVPAQLVQPLVVSDAQAIAGLVSLTVIARRDQVNHVLGEVGLLAESDEPESIGSVVLNCDDPVLVRR